MAVDGPVADDALIGVCSPFLTCGSGYSFPDGMLDFICGRKELPHLMIQQADRRLPIE
jgi:hypothetical protein